VAGDIAAVFLAERPRLFGLAYRMLGSAADAEDVLQTAFERWIAADEQAIAVPAAWLTTMVTNLCLTLLGSARRQREKYPGTWLPEPVLTAGGALGPLETAEQRESVSFALLVLMERLTPAERAVFVLHTAFGYRYADIARILDRPEASCRQLHHRARQRLDIPARRFQPEPGKWRQLIEQFLVAAADGEMAGIERLLAADVVSLTDGEGSDLAMARKPVTGRPAVAGFFARLSPKYAAGIAVTMTEVNGQPAVLGWREDELFAVFVPEFDGTAIAAIRIVTNPAKLAFAAAQAAAAGRR
jgi:RNA polymerase sigma factor (sigma-70 family)